MKGTYGVLAIWLALMLLICLTNKSVYALKVINGVSKQLAGKDPLAGLSDEELEGMMKKYGLSTKELGSIASKSMSKNEHSLSHSKKTEFLNYQDNVNDLYKKNSKAIKRLYLDKRDAFNLLYLLMQSKYFLRLPTTARNIISVFI